MEKRLKFKKFKKPKIWVLGNVIMKAHAKSLDASINRKYPKVEGNCTMTWILLCPKTVKTVKIQEDFRNSEIQKFGCYGMLLWRRMQNFRKLTQFRISKIAGELQTICEASDEDPDPYDKNFVSKFKTVEPDGIPTHSKRWFVHLDKVNTKWKYFFSSQCLLLITFFPCSMHHSSTVARNNFFFSVWVEYRLSFFF